MFTQRAALLGFVAFCFYLVSVVNSLPSFYFALTWLVMGILVASWGIAMLSLTGLKCDLKTVRACAPASFSPDEAGGPSLSAALSNAGTLHKTGVLIEFRLRDAENALQFVRFMLAAVPSGAAIEANLPLSTLKRGQYQLEDARLRGSDVLGLFRVQRRLGLDDINREILVGPPLVRVESRENGAGGARGGGARALQLSRGDELRGTRPYAPGDDLRHVHWKSSARAGELVVKEFEQTGRETPLVIWDGAAQTTWGVGEWDSTEWSLMVCASLCRALLARGAPCDFARLDGAPIGIEARALIGAELPSPLTEALARARAERQTPLENAVREVTNLRARSYSTVMIVTASLAPDVVSLAQGWRRRGARVRVVLVDSASLGARSSDRRFRRGSARLPFQGEGAASIAVTAENFALQVAALRCQDVAVTTLAATDETPEGAIYAALREVL